MAGHTHLPTASGSHEASPAIPGMDSHQNSPSKTLPDHEPWRPTLNRSRKKPRPSRTRRPLTDQYHVVEYDNRSKNINSCLIRPADHCTADIFYKVDISESDVQIGPRLGVETVIQICSGHWDPSGDLKKLIEIRWVEGQAPTKLGGFKGEGDEWTTEEDVLNDWLMIPDGHRTLNLSAKEGAIMIGEKAYRIAIFGRTYLLTSIDPKADGGYTELARFALGACEPNPGQIDKADIFEFNPSEPVDQEMRQSFVFAVVYLMYEQERELFRRLREGLWGL